MIVRRALFVVLVLASIVLDGTEARADPSEAALYGLDFRGDTRDASIEILRKFKRGTALSDDEKRRLAIVVQRLANTGGWQAAALMAFVAPDRTLFPRHPKTLGRLVEALKARDQEAAAAKAKRASRKQVDVCRPVADALAQLLSDERPLPPVTHTMLTEQVEGRTCLPAEEVAEIEKTHTFLTIVAGESDTVRVLTSGKSPEYFELGKEDRVERGNRHVYFTPVPIGALVTVRVSRAGRAVPLVWSYSAVGSDVLMGHDLGCVDVDVTGVGSSTTVLLDGAKIEPSGIQYWDLPKQRDQALERHELVVLRGQTVLTRRVLPPALLRETTCRRIPIDLGKVRNDSDVSLAEANVAQSCEAAGIDGRELYTFGEDALTSLGQPPQPFEGWAAIPDGGELRRLLVPAAGAPESDNGQLSRDATALPEPDPAKVQALVRTGFGKLLAVELSCAKKGDREWEYLVVVRSLRLGGEAARARQSRRIARGVTRELADLRGVLSQTFGKLLERNYVRFTGAPEDRSLSSALDLGIDVYLPIKVDPEPYVDPDPTCWTSHEGVKDPYVIHLCGARLKEDEIASICRPLASAAADHPEQVPIEGWRDFGYIPVPQHVNETPGQAKINARPPRPGTYLLQVHAVETRRDVSQAVAYRCVEVNAPRTYVWADIGYAGAVTMARRAAHDQHVDHVRMLVGVTYQIESPFWIGLQAGYARTSHVRSTVPSWQDYFSTGGAAVAGAPDRVSWVRHAFTFGPTFDLRLPVCWAAAACRSLLRRIDVFGRTSLALDLGFIDAGNVPASFTDFARGASGVDVDVDLDFQLGVSMALTSRFRALLKGEMGFLGLNDWFGGDRDLVRAKQRRIDAAGIFTAGIFAGVEIGP